VYRRQQHQSDSLDDSDGEPQGRGQLGSSRLQQAVQQPTAAAAAAAAPLAPAPGRKKQTLSKSDLLAVPIENLSKWQRKKRNKKLRQQQQQEASGGS
jgi:hypothetical protein